MSYNREQIIETINKTFSEEERRNIRVFAGAAMVLHGLIETTNDINVWVTTDCTCQYCTITPGGKTTHRLFSVRHGLTDVCLGSAPCANPMGVVAFWDGTREDTDSCMAAWYRYKYTRPGCPDSTIEALSVDSLWSLWMWYTYMRVVQPDSAKYKEYANLAATAYLPQEKNREEKSIGV